MRSSSKCGREYHFARQIRIEPTKQFRYRGRRRRLSPMSPFPDLQPPEETLDPADWEQFRKFAHGVVNDTISFLATLRERGAWAAMPEEVRASFNEPLPREPAGA